MIAHAPRHCALLCHVRHLIRLALDAYKTTIGYHLYIDCALIISDKLLSLFSYLVFLLTRVHDVVTANGTVVNVNIYMKGVCQV